VIAAIYARKSTDQSDRTDDATSVARQIAHARKFAADRGWIVSEEHIYSDAAISGAEFANRPAFVKLMASLKPRAAFDVVIAAEESRFGREAIATAYALQQIIQAGVKVWFYLDARERRLDSPTDKIMLSLTAFADELEREKGRQRTYDAMIRKARNGHVTGGKLFGYDNVEILGPDGRRSHVERRINDAEAAIVRQIFQLAASGYGLKRITHQLNATGALSPRAQRGRSHTWATSSVRAVLRNDTYRGQVLWGTTKKRDRWGRHHQTDLPADQWIRTAAEPLRIISDDLWNATHRRLAAAYAVYGGGERSGRPACGTTSKFLLTNLANCGRCGASLQVRSRRSTGTARRFFYGCGSFHNRGKAVCPNSCDAPMSATDRVVIDILLRRVLDPAMLRDAIGQALELLAGPERQDPRRGLDAEIARIDAERTRLVSAITAGGALDSLLDALRTREGDRMRLQAQRDAVRVPERLRASDLGRVRRELEQRADDWRIVLTDDPDHARPIVTKLLDGRVTITPLDEPRQWQITGNATFAGFFREIAYPQGVRPHAELHPAEILFSERYAA